MNCLCMVFQYRTPIFGWDTDLLAVLMESSIPFLIFFALFGMFLSFKYLKGKGEGFSQEERLYITWIAQASIGSALLIDFVFSIYILNSLEMFFMIAFFFPFIFGVAGAAVGYWIFILSKHRASFRVLFKRGFLITVFIYLGIPPAVFFTFLYSLVMES